MQVPEHLVSFYVATCGQNGPGLGSDEKEIILLVYVILEAATGQIIGTKQILVRPEGTFVKDRTTSTSSDASNNASSPPLAITYADSVNNSSCSSNNLNSTNNSINSLNITNNSSTPTSPISNTNISNNNTIIPSSATTINNNNTIVNNNNITNGPTTLGPVEIIELPIAVAQAAGKPLQEAIEEFDEYLRSLSLHETEFKIVTDGQLPLRQCLHREACVKEIGLPSYYNKFSDLRKEFSIHKSGDLSRALVPVKDIKRILQMPAATLPQSIGEIMKELNIPSLDDSEFYMRESCDMVSVIQHLLKAGHTFTANETVSLVLEPGICSIDDEIDGNCIVRARGLPWQSSDQDIAKFFRGLNVAKGGVALCLSPLGRRNGEALIRFISQEHRDMALKRHKHHIGNRYIEVYRATGDDFLSVAGGASNEAQAFLSKGAQVIIRMRGLPYDCTAKQVLDFFTNGENPCNVLDNTEGVLFVKKPDGRATGDAFVLFANEGDAPKALARHRESIGQRYIELFRSTTAEVQQVLNRSLDPKTYEPNHQPPLIAQLPPMQLSLLPQHLITSGTTKNCIRLRGLPYEALVEHILHFLDDFAKHIIFQGVHMVINAQGQPSGEAFIQMDSEESARLCAQRKHHQFMVFGKKYRYIEVFQCSGDDMNMVLNGGLQSPVPAAHTHPHMGAGKQPSLLSPGASVIGTPFGHFGPFPPPGSILASPHRAPHHPPPHPAAFYPHPLVYWPYPSPPVSPTTYFNQPTHSPTHVPGAHGPPPMYSLDYIPAVQPTNYANPTSPLSPPTVGIPTNTSGLILSPNKAPTMTLVPSPKQYPAVAPGPAPTVASIAATYHSKMALQPAHPPPARHAPHTNLYHHYNSPTPLQTATVLAVPPPPPALPTHSATAVAHTPPGGILKPPPTEQPLLAIDTSHTVEHSALKTNTKAANTSNAPSLPAAKPKTIVLAKDATDTSSSSSSSSSSSLSSSSVAATSNMNGAATIVTNHCVEMYTS